MLNRLFIFLFFMTLQYIYPIFEPGQKIIINTPIASVWTEPITYSHFPKGPLLSTNIKEHDTQMIYGEKGRVLNDPGCGWIYIECLEQPGFNKETESWESCKGWIKENQVIAVDKFLTPNIVIKKPSASLYLNKDEEDKDFLKLFFGTYLCGIEFKKYWLITLADGSEKCIKKQDVNLLSAKSKSLTKLRNQLTAYYRINPFINSPYIWGGRSLYTYNQTNISGVDCSGLVNLLYRSVGLTIPRNAHAQYMKAIAIDPKDLQPGDLIFLKNQKNRVTHVMMYLKDDSFLEATGIPAVEKTRITTFTDYFGKPLTSITQGMSYTRLGVDYTVHCGSFLLTIEQKNSLC